MQVEWHEAPPRLNNHQNTYMTLILSLKQLISLNKVDIYFIEMGTEVESWAEFFPLPE